MRLTQAEIEAREVRRVIHQARNDAKNAVLRSIKAQGFKAAKYSCKEIMIWADLYFDDHSEALLAEACAELRKYEKRTAPCSSSEILVQNLGAK